MWVTYVLMFLAVALGTACRSVVSDRPDNVIRDGRGAASENSYREYLQCATYEEFVNATRARVSISGETVRVIVAILDYRETKQKDDLAKAAFEINNLSFAANVDGTQCDRDYSVVAVNLNVGLRPRGKEYVYRVRRRDFVVTDVEGQGFSYRRHHDR